MTEYIEKDLIYKKVAEMEELARNRYLDTPSNSPVYARYLAQLQERTSLKFFIADFPAADVVPMVHGRWISDGDGYHWSYNCSICAWEDGYPFNERHNYCPNCGAKMDLEEEHGQGLRCKR